MCIISLRKGLEETQAPRGKLSNVALRSPINWGGGQKVSPEFLLNAGIGGSNSYPL